MTVDHARAELMSQWTAAMRDQHLMPVLLLGVDLDDPTNTALFMTEGIDDEVTSVVLAELSQRIAREVAENKL